MSSSSNHLFLTAEYALGLLNLQETAQAHTLLGSDYQAVVNALKWEDRFLALADQLTPIEAPADLLLQIQTTLGHDTTVPLRPSAVHPEKTANLSAPLPSTQIPAKQAHSPSQPRPVLPAVAKKTAAAARSGRTRLGWSPRLWRMGAIILAAGLAAAILLPLNRHDFTAAPSLSDSNEGSAIVAPAPVHQLAAVLQAPGQSSTPGWVVTLDRQGNLILTPRVNIEIPEHSAVYLWARNDSEPPRLLAALSPNTPATVPADAAGSLPPGQIFEITQEAREPTPPLAPKGPILFIGRLVELN